LYGHDGDDILAGGPGSDYVTDGPFDVKLKPDKDVLSGGSGNDFLDAANEPAFRDIIRCGSGEDEVWADKRDLVSEDCETVEVFTF
jgi:hemolysin type calcium-binding protein